LLRLLRVIQIFDNLKLFFEALYTMLSPFFVVIAFLFGLTFSVAIILTHIVGHGEGMDSETLTDDYDKEVRVVFADVPTSFFSLFKVITMDNWMSVSLPLIKLDRRWRLFFMMFIAFCSWTMISILTAVASDNVIATTSARKEREAEELLNQRKEFSRLLREMFVDADEDGNGLLDKDEFNDMIESARLHETLLTLNISIHIEDLYKTWDMLDIRGAGVLTIDEFVDGLAWLHEDAVSTRRIASIDYDIRKLSQSLRNKLGRLMRKITVTRKQNQKLLHTLRCQEQAKVEQVNALKLWQQWNAGRDLSETAFLYSSTFPGREDKYEDQVTE